MDNDLKMMVSTPIYLYSHPKSLLMADSTLRLGSGTGTAALAGIGM